VEQISNSAADLQRLETVLSGQDVGQIFEAIVALPVKSCLGQFQPDIYFVLDDLEEHLESWTLLQSILTLRHSMGGWARSIHLIFGCRHRGQLEQLQVQLADDVLILDLNDIQLPYQDQAIRQYFRQAVHADSERNHIPMSSDQLEEVIAAVLVVCDRNFAFAARLMRELQSAWTLQDSLTGDGAVGLVKKLRLVSASEQLWLDPLYEKILEKIFFRL
jgi:hypothetical protein